MSCVLPSAFFNHDNETARRTMRARARVACGDMMYSCSSQCMRGAIVF